MLAAEMPRATSDPITEIIGDYRGSPSRSCTSVSTGWASSTSASSSVTKFDEFSRVHRAALTGRQFQSAAVDPVYVLFEDFAHVKLYRRSFFDVVEDAEGASRASPTSTTGCRSGWSPPPARTRCRADVGLPPGYKTARCASVPQ